MVADIFQTKLLDGRPAKFLRTYGRYKFIVEIDGHELAILREVWRSLPFLSEAVTLAPDIDAHDAALHRDPIEGRRT